MIVKQKIKRNVAGQFVKLLFHKQDNRKMNLANFKTRCIREGEIHEIVTTIYGDLVEGDIINVVGFLGFIEINKGGVIQKGDIVKVADKHIGTVLGFDECHFPNHYNIIIKTDKVLSSQDLDIIIEDPIIFVDSGNKNI
ncbi:hypothetical protein ACEOWJ_000888 [Bacillus cereus]|uniref:DUF6917 domain-containing protein n=1 Tax=Bacillus TaxID=1386 RepID=UPI0005569D39|nr:hypothetical protein [Bacillus sp. UNC322MFChir4.1]